MPSRSYPAKCRDRVKSLKRRKSYLQMRTLESGRTGPDFDKQEIDALEWAIAILEAHIQELAVKTGPIKKVENK